MGIDAGTQYYRIPIYVHVSKGRLQDLELTFP